MQGTGSHEPERSPDGPRTLRRAQRMEAVGRLAGGLAHDFNNLLTAIRGYTGFLLDDLPDGASRSDVEQIQRVTERAVVLTRQLVMLGRRPVSQPTVLDPCTVLEDLGGMLGAALGEDLELGWELDRRGGLVHMDRAELEQVAINLVLDARDALPEGGRVQVALARRRAAGSPDRVELRVEDGRPDAHGPPGAAEGDGLRLRIVREIVAEAGGEVEVGRSANGRARVVVSLPAIDERADPAGDEAGVGAERWGGGATVLLVEDDEQVRSVVRRTLEEGGYGVVEAGDGTAALRELEALDGAPDLLLTDAVLPGLSGADLTERVRRTLPTLPVLVMSGHTRDMAVLRRVEALEVPVLNKPFTPADLLARVGLLVGAGPSR